MAEVLVLGAGPAGLAAAVTAARAGARVTVVDLLPEPGGQVWRGLWRSLHPGAAAPWFSALRELPIDLRLRTRAVTAPAPGRLGVEGPGGPGGIAYDRLVLATGARERFLPFPGWTLPGVLGAGALQALVKGGLEVRGRRVVVSGSGPLLWAVGAHLREAGAEVVRVAEQAPLGNLLPLAGPLLRHPGKLRQAAGFLGLPFRSGAWVLRAEGDGRLERVLLREGGRERWVPCDLLACGFGLLPALEAAQMLGCATLDGRVVVDSLQRTSVADIFAAGEPTGVGGLDKALLEGRVAGLAAAGREADAKALAPQVRAERAFVRALEAAFALRRELRALPEPDTVFCRCEDVAYGQLLPLSRGRDARLHARCGMGACQGRTCGPAAAFHFGWEPGGPRQPLFPAAFAALLNDREQTS